MIRSFFAGTYGGDDSRLRDNARLECKICWYVYDPVEGDAESQVPPGTPFSTLPASWTCPRCDGVKKDFLVIHE